MKPLHKLEGFSLSIIFFALSPKMFTTQTLCLQFVCKNKNSVLNMTQLSLHACFLVRGNMSSNVMLDGHVFNVVL